MFQRTIAAVVTAGLATGAAGQSAYTLLDIGLPPGQANVVPVRMAEDGRALVYSTLSGGGTRSYLWSGGQFVDLGLFQANLLRNEASDINASGVIAGSSWSTNGFPARAWKWAGGTYTQLPTLGGSYANAYSISDTGLMTGWADPPAPGIFRAFVYDGTIIRNLGEVLGNVSSTGYAVNSEGWVACAGNAPVNAPWARAAIASLAEGMHEIGTLGGPRSFVQEINELGHVVGSSDIAAGSVFEAAFNIQHAYLWRDGVMTDLGSLPGFPRSFASGLNNSDVAVGMARVSTSNNDPVRAVRWINGECVDLNAIVQGGTAGHVMTWARSINDAGEILVQSTLGGQQRVVLLTPVR